ncbi:hypothetical protein IQ254_03980 [Nodosilinea sp. LEGE 07088]|uniref:hypothetical protein n=1 Tax=Nodosilinea sp. LEGE 07088 TaxID=2777968 RepID=UPI00187F1EE4|nr:hypothetical protein [Nodosilinea sp. LEGE 07088]MBE9136367.1 hypothetical protein [Nodosilinea sp. LEGE 07088]
MKCCAWAQTDRGEVPAIQAEGQYRSAERLSDLRTERKLTATVPNEGSEYGHSRGAGNPRGDRLACLGN